MSEQMTAFSKIQSHFDVLERVEPILDNVKLEDTIEKKALLKSIDQLWESTSFILYSLQSICWRKVSAWYPLYYSRLAHRSRVSPEKP